MPDTLSLSAGVSFGLLAGIVSGVCYLVANGLVWQKSEQDRRRCLTSGREDSGVCRRCGGDKQGGFVPCICYIRDEPPKFESGAWFLRQAQRAAATMPWSISTDKLEQIEEECDDRDSPGPSDPTRAELRKIREFLETLAAKLAGGPLEGTRVTPLYDHPAYLPPPRNASPSSVSSDRHSASGAHARLKRLVSRVVEEAASLPALSHYAAEPTSPVDHATYEDLLATAILNKVIERYQNESGSGGRSSGIHSASASPTPSERSSPRSLNSRHNRDITPPLREEDVVSDWEEGDGSEEALDVPRRVPFPEFGGDIVHSTDNEERDFDEVSGSDLQAVDGTWEENWLFQKKKIKTIQSVPVPMLVPNSNTEYRALIGDRDADDTTDLSDNASDSEEQIEYKSDIKRVLDSKHEIGGKLKAEDYDFEPDSLTIIDGANGFDDLVEKEYKGDDTVDAIINEINDNNVTIVETINDNISEQTDGKLVISIDSGPLPKAEFNLKEEIHRTALNGDEEETTHYLNNGNSNEHNGIVEGNSVENYSKKALTNTLSHHEREREYEETVTVPVQRYADSLRRKHFDSVPHEIPTRDTDHEELIPGSIAYRERKKWLNYVEMPNNPYSPEAIQKRLSAKSTSSLFDTLTSKRDMDDEESNISTDVVDGEARNNDVKTKTTRHSKLSLTISNDSINSIGRSSISPSPRILKDIIGDEIPQYKRYGRDYYVREAKASSGGRKKGSFSESSTASSMNKSTSLDNLECEFASPGLLIKQFNTIATNQHYNKFVGQNNQESITTTVNNKSEILIEYEDANEQTLFAAKPAYVDDDTDKKFEEILQSAYKTNAPAPIVVEDKPIDEPIKSPVSVDNSYISTSSLEDSIKIYNVQTGEIIKCKPEDNVSVRYESDKSDNIDSADKNISGAESVSSGNDILEDAVTTNESRLELIESEDLLLQLPKVKELAKKFVSMENLNAPEKTSQPYSRRRKSKENILSEFKPEKSKAMYMHSLTARSISKEFREELKMSMSTPLTVPGGSKEIPEGIEEVTKESSRPGSPVPEPGTIKTKLAFFESLKAKLSNK